MKKKIKQFATRLRDDVNVMLSSLGIRSGDVAHSAVASDPVDIEEVIFGFYDSVPMEFINKALRVLAVDQYDASAEPNVGNNCVEFTQMNLAVHRAEIHYKLIGASFAGGSLTLNTRVTITTIPAMDSQEKSVHVFEKCLMLAMRMHGTLPNWFDQCLCVPVEALDDPSIRESLYLSRESEMWLRMIYLTHKSSPGHERYIVQHTSNELLVDALLTMFQLDINVVTPLSTKPDRDMGRHRLITLFDEAYTEAKRMGFAEMPERDSTIKKGAEL